MALRVISDSAVVDPLLDAETSRALLRAVAAGEEPDTLRISRPGPSVAFGRRDAIDPGYSSAVSAGRAAGFEPVERLAGGRAAVFHEQTVHVGITLHEPDPRPGVTPRFEATARAFQRALRALGVEARVGEVPGEYCPGRHSVNARGTVKLVGLAQRVVHRAAHLGAVVVVDEPDRIRTVLTPVYEALGLAWRPETIGSIAGEVGPVGWDVVRAAIESELALDRELVG